LFLKKKKKLISASFFNFDNTDIIVLKNNSGFIYRL